MNRNDKLYRQYFPKLPHCMTLEKSLKVNFHNQVNRLSINSKVTSLVYKANNIINILKHEEKSIFVFLFKLFIIFTKVERIFEQIQDNCFIGQACSSLERSIFYYSNLKNLEFPLKILNFF